MLDSERDKLAAAASTAGSKNGRARGIESELQNLLDKLPDRASPQLESTLDPRRETRSTVVIQDQSAPLHASLKHIT